jgi:GTPase SAR1 family protein
MCSGISDHGEYDSLRRFSIQARWGDVFMICIPMCGERDFRTDFRELEEIIESLYQHIDRDPEPVPIVIVGTKCDLFSGTKEEERLRDTQLGEFCDKHHCGYVMTSARDTINVHEAFEMAVHESTGVSHWELSQMEQGKMVLEEIVRKPTKKCILM